MRQAQPLLDQGLNAAEVGRRLKISADTIRQAISAGRLLLPAKTEITETTASSGPSATKSERTVEANQTALGMACSRETERVQAALGDLNGAAPAFTPQTDVAKAGVLVAIPALLANGLLKHSSDCFQLPKGFYSLPSLLLTLACLLLQRVKSLEGVRYIDPGELGKTIGLDRIPEVRTLREKVHYLADHGRLEDWSKALAKDWLAETPEDIAGLLYVDGHVRVYHGAQTKLPRWYVSRERLCLRGLADYWVNDALGQPFFVVTRTVNAGLIAVLKEELVPRLLTDVPNQPSAEDLATHRFKPRFGLIFDREGYSPALLKKLWQDHRIACYTYRKRVTDLWPESEFEEQTVTFPNGEVVTLKLAERGVYHGGEKFWFREIRKLTETGHQTAVVTTDFSRAGGEVGAVMFSRWSQENFFRYMIQHYDIDRLMEYGGQEMNETVLVVNPAWRELDNRIRSLAAKLSRQKALYAGLILTGEIEESAVKDFVRRKADQHEKVENLIAELSGLKETKKKTEHHLEFKDLPPEHKFKTLKSRGKQFLDTLKMIAYRAETALANILRQDMRKKDEARALVRQILTTDADLEPNYDQGILKVRLHNLTNPLHQRYAQNLLRALNETETLFPGTNLKLVYEMVSFQFHADQVV